MPGTEIFFEVVQGHLAPLAEIEDQVSLQYHLAATVDEFDIKHATFYER